MLFRDILGNEPVKKELLRTSLSGRISHSQLISGPEGSGALLMAIAYAREILCGAQLKNVSACNIKVSGLKHPDLHFIYPVANNPEIKSRAISSNFLTSWREFLNNTPYGSLFDWYTHLGIENKQGKIGKDEAEDLIKKLSLKPYEGGWKCVIIWMAEKMNSSATNKLLKLIEEPPKKTLFLFVSESPVLLMDTLLSRCQRIDLKKISVHEIEKGLLSKGYSAEISKQAAFGSDGNYNKALSFANRSENDSLFEGWFQSWVRSAFKVKRDKEAVLELVDWSKNVSKQGRETQKSFIRYSLAIFRQAVLTNYGLDQITSYRSSTDFDFQSFSKYIGGANIEDLSIELEKAHSQIQSNGNPNMVFSDLSLKLTRLIHKT